MALKRQFIFLLLLTVLSAACQDTTTVADTNQVITNRNWSYVNKVRVPVMIEDNSIVYNVYINLRHTADYKYSNIFLLIRNQGPDGKVVTVRKEFKLAYPDGQWLGKGSGNLFSYQLPFYQNYRFPAKGKYIFEVEQNMRDNPLKEVTDVGIRVERSN